MNDALIALTKSRKSIVGLGAIVMAGIVILVGIYTRAEKEYVLGYVAAISALAFKLIAAIAQEDAARIGGEATVTAAKSMAPPAMRSAPSVVVPAGDGIPVDLEIER